MAIYVTGKGTRFPWGTASGLADASASRPLGVDTPLRVASNTKMFVAAAVLRLWEQGRIDIDASIAAAATPDLVAVLQAGGYRTESITVRQLMNHSAGLYDHGDDPRFIPAVLADPSHHWTRDEQVRLSTGYAGPQSEPGSRFQYSDTGYVVLGDLVERATGETLAAVVRKELRFDARALRSTWWELFEQPPSHVEPRARQFLGDRDMTDVNATMDLYGGGGLVMSARDLASFAADLFEGRVFDNPQTLAEMLKAGSHEGADAYRLGVFVGEIGGAVCYSHAGFWGTVVYYMPQHGIAVSGVTTVRGARPELVSIIETAIGEWVR
ncbi:serine hydrolase [Burkholderia ubonensis subsp. mesacidophila]|uniref:Serine hydrolase n=2 Tax=Burkholderia ubonensis TaxID=101571 RepID=A0A2A4FP56_9BURK|nr:serine hydrolase [Burkholderia ubonensis subsp. mesacidophila]